MHGAAATPTSPALAAYFRGSALLAAAGAAAPDAQVQDEWLPWGAGRLHIDFHAAAAPRAVVLFHPGVGSYARFYAPLGHALARAGYHWWGLDRPGHGWSDGARGDCTVQEALDLTAAAMDEARRRFGLPVVLAGSSMGGLLTGFALLAGLRPDLAVAHNFVLPGRLISMRLRARVVRRWRRKPYPLAELAHGFKGISRDPALLAYLRERADPQVAWHQSVEAVASLFAHNPPRPGEATAPLVVLTGADDRIIPSWATRGFVRWAGLRPRAVHVLPGAGHMLFHDELAQTLPMLLQVLREGLEGAGTKKAQEEFEQPNAEDAKVAQRTQKTS